MKVLDKGFVRLVDSMGDDSAIVQAARVSYGKGTKTLREDQKLIDYLLKNKHLTPFEMVVFKFHVKVPIFIANQWKRHRMGTFNEVSSRYSVMKDEFYIPDLSRFQKQSGKNKQCSGEQLDEDIQSDAQHKIEMFCQNAYVSYQYMLEIGVSREIARIILPVNLYTEFYWKVDLRNLLSFISLRVDEHAQWEIQQYGHAICDIIKDIVPSAFHSFIEDKYTK